MFYDSGFDAYVEATGALTGAGVRHEDNATTIACYKERHECLVSSVEQIGPSQIGRLTAPTSYPIIKWDKYEIIATDGDNDPYACRKTTISLERQDETVLWVEEPINQVRAFCKNSDTNLYKWTMDDPPFWRILHATQ